MSTPSGIASGSPGDWPAGPVVHIGSRVRLRASAADQEVVIVGSPEEEGVVFRLSPRVPLARALLGRRPGDQVRVTTVAGEALYVVVSVLT